MVSVAQTIVIGDASTECNTTTLTMFGDEDFEDTLDTLVAAGTWTEADKIQAMIDSDGYKITLK